MPMFVRVINYDGTRYDSDSRGFYKVVTPMYVFKKVYALSGAIANLVIPAGATIFIDPRAFIPGADASNRKMRASEAFVHSIAMQRTGTPLKEAESRWISTFKYRAGKTVKPVQRFSWRSLQCEAGIHFFVNLADAKGWA